MSLREEKLGRSIRHRRVERAQRGDGREQVLDFLDSLWSAEGAFHGSWADDQADAEYTFYGLVALGHASV